MAIMVGSCHQAGSMVLDLELTTTSSENTRKRKTFEMARGFEISNLVFRDLSSPTRPHLVILLKEFYQLTKEFEYLRDILLQTTTKGDSVSSEILGLRS